MKDLSRKTAGDLRKMHNQDLIRRMRAGEPLNSVDSKASWYPPRPLIKKDKVEMDRLYPTDGALGASAHDAPVPRPERDEKVVRLTRGPALPPLGEAS